MGTIRNQDKKTVLELIEEEPYMYIWDVSEELRDDPDVVLAFAKKQKSAMPMEYAGDSLKNDKDFLIQVARCDENGYADGLAVVLSYAGDTVRNDKQFFIEMLKIDGSFDSFIGDSLKDDDDLKLISAISNLGNRFDNSTYFNNFEQKVNRFLSYVKNGVSVRGEDKRKPYSFRVELENYELSKNYGTGMIDKLEPKDVFLQEFPEEVKRQIELLEHIKEVALMKEKNPEIKSPLQQREKELSSLEAEEKELKAKIDKQVEQEGQNIGE